MLISVVITILSILGLLAFESFFITLFSFSLVIISTLLILDKIDWKKWLLFTIPLTLLVDIVLHRTVGVTLFAISCSVGILYLFFLFVPRKQVLLSYIPYFFSIFLFYTIVKLISPLAQDSVWGVVTLNNVFWYLIKALISTVLIFVVNILIDRFRTDSQISL